MATRPSSPPSNGVTDSDSDVEDWDDDVDEAPPEPDRNVKVFEIAQRDDKDEPPPPPVAFALKFTNIKDKGEEVHTFHAEADPGARGVLSMATVVRYNEETGRREYDLNGLVYYFSAVLVEGDFQRLRDLLFRKDLVIPMESLSEVYQWLVTDVYTGRSPLAPVASRRSRRAAGSRSTARRR